MTVIRNLIHAVIVVIQYNNYITKSTSYYFRYISLRSNVTSVLYIVVTFLLSVLN